MRGCFVTSEKKNTPRSKKPYSTPSLTVHSLAALATGADARSNGERPLAATAESSPAFQPPPLVIEGFPGKVEDLVKVLSSIPLGLRGRLDSSAAPAETAAGKVGGRVYILLADMRCRIAGPRQPLTRLELDGDFSAALILILTDAGEDFRAGGEIRWDRWHFKGPTAAEDLTVLVKSLFEAPVARAQGR